MIAANRLIINSYFYCTTIERYNICTSIMCELWFSVVNRILWSYHRIVCVRTFKSINAYLICVNECARSFVRFLRFDVFCVWTNSFCFRLCDADRWARERFFFYYTFNPHSCGESDECADAAAAGRHSITRELFSICILMLCFTHLFVHVCAG